MKIINIGELKIGKPNPLVLIAGPCVIENQEICEEIAETLIKICKKEQIQYIFKASFDKANRTSGESFRGVGMAKGLRILNFIKQKYNVPVLTDVHEVLQIKLVSEIVDVIQIPAFLCRQTDLIVAAAMTGKIVNVKKGQFLAPQDVRNIILKIESVGKKNILITERGTTFGYNNLVVDMRGLPIMRRFGYPLIFDVTHSIQSPGGMGNQSGGDVWLAPYLARGAIAIGCDGLFIETHPNPEKAMSDKNSMIPLKEMELLLHIIKEIDQISLKYN